MKNIYNNHQPFLTQLKTKTMKSTPLNFTALFIFLCTIGFAGFTKCEAQAIVGKWKGVSAKFVYSAGAKQMGKEMEEQLNEIRNHHYEFKSDHSFILTSAAHNSTETMVLKGTWRLSGDQLTTTLDAHQPDPEYNPEKGEASDTMIIQISGNTLIMTEIQKNNSTVNKIEYTYKKV